MCLCSVRDQAATERAGQTAPVIAGGFVNEGKKQIMRQLFSPAFGSSLYLGLAISRVVLPPLLSPARVADQTVYHDAERASYVLVPVLPNR